MELGAQVLSTQMDLIQSQTRCSALTEMMNEVETKESLAELLEDLRTCEEEREHQVELLDSLESELREYREHI